MASFRKLITLALSLSPVGALPADPSGSRVRVFLPEVSGLVYLLAQTPGGRSPVFRLDPGSANDIAFPQMETAPIQWVVMDGEGRILVRKACGELLTDRLLVLIPDDASWDVVSLPIPAEGELLVINAAPEPVALRIDGEAHRDIATGLGALLQPGGRARRLPFEVTGSGAAAPLRNQLLWPGDGAAILFIDRRGERWILDRYWLETPENAPGDKSPGARPIP